MIYVDMDNDIETHNSSKAKVQFLNEGDIKPACFKIVFAGLYWTGRAHIYNNSPHESTISWGQILSEECAC